MTSVNVDGVVREVLLSENAILRIGGVVREVLVSGATPQLYGGTSPIRARLRYAVLTPPQIQPKTRSYVYIPAGPAPSPIYPAPPPSRVRLRYKVIDEKSPRLPRRGYAVPALPLPVYSVLPPIRTRLLYSRPPKVNLRSRAPGNYSIPPLDQFVFDQIFSGRLVAGIPPVRFAGLSRRVLLAGSPPVKFSRISRNALSLVLPPTGFGPVPPLTVTQVGGNPTDPPSPPPTPPVFPPPPAGFPVKVSPVMDTIVGTTKSLREMRVAQQIYPIWDIEILFEGLKDQTQNETPYAPFAGFTQYQQIVEDWLTMYGQASVFAYDCPWDDSRENQYIATGDGLTYTFTIMRSWGSGANATFAPIGKVNQVFAVYVNGTLAPTYTYSCSGNTLTFTSAEGNAYPPANGAEVTMTFSFYYMCRFVADEQDFEEFAKNRWTIPSLKFRASPFLWS